MKLLRRSRALAAWSTPSSATTSADAPELSRRLPVTQQIQHLIGGKPVRSSSYFETINPATQEVLAEVAAGGETEVNAAVAAAKAAFPRWAGLAQKERARLM